MAVTIRPRRLRAPATSGAESGMRVMRCGPEHVLHLEDRDTEDLVRDRHRDIVAGALVAVRSMACPLCQRL